MQTLRWHSRKKEQQGIQRGEKKKHCYCGVLSHGPSTITREKALDN